MGQGIAHILRAHLIQGRIPDGVLFGEQVRQELYGRAESSENETSMWTYPDFYDGFLGSLRVTESTTCLQSLKQTFFELPESPLGVQASPSRLPLFRAIEFKHGDVHRNDNNNNKLYKQVRPEGDQKVGSIAERGFNKR